MDNVVKFNGNTTLDIPVDYVLDGAKKEGLKQVITVGLYPDGRPYLAGSQGNPAEVMMMLIKAQKDLLEWTE